jgi:hypothetical protein
MAGTLAAVKKELRKKMQDILKHLPDAAAASQSMLYIIHRDSSAYTC